MSGHVLIVDAVATSRIMFKAKLSSAFYDVRLASSLREARREIGKSSPSAIIVGSVESALLEQIVKSLRLDPKLSGIPVLVVLEEQCQDARLRMLEAGADDVLTRPVQDAVLIAQLRALQRARDTAAELAIRANTQSELGLAEPPRAFAPAARIAVLQNTHMRRDPLIVEVTERCGHAVSWITPHGMVAGRYSGANQAPPDAFLLLLDSEADTDTGRHLIAELRAHAETRHSAVLVVMKGAINSSLSPLFDIGANDAVWLDEVSTAEMLWRLERQIKQKQQADKLRATTTAGLKAAVTDPLTGLHNRRYAMPHLLRRIEAARSGARPFALMMADLDHFKSINDQFGHAAGDAVLAQVAHRLKDQIRSVDLLARIGGEEFLMAMPDISRPEAIATAQRLCALIGDAPFEVPLLAAPISVTISIGVAICDGADPAAPGAICPSDELSRLMRDADCALYDAKAHGRNKVELSQNAAA